MAAGRGARLLTEILDISLNENRSIFERKEFTTRMEFISSVENTGFAVTLRRLEAALERTSSPVRIQPDRRGGFQLKILRPWRFERGDSPHRNRIDPGEPRTGVALDPPAVPEPGPGFSALLVEDHRFVREALQGLLDQSGEFSRIDTASTIHGAIRCCSAWTYDIIVLDLSLPDAEGFEAMDRITLRHSAIPLLVLSAQENPGIRSHCLAMGAARYQDKTASGAEILEAILATAREGRDRARGARRTSP